MPSLSAIVLAAGAGTRMKSIHPKPLHEICGKPMVAHVLCALDGLGIDQTVVVVGYGAEEMTRRLENEQVNNQPINFAEQKVQNGTGEAVSIALGAMTNELDDTEVIIVPGDMPLLRTQNLLALLDHHRYAKASATILTVKPDDPTGCGRIVRDKYGRVQQIVEERDASDKQRSIDEVNTSVYCFNMSLLRAALNRINTNNAQGEYYLTDAIELLAGAGHVIETVDAGDVAWAVGVNDRMQLSAAEIEIRRRTNEHWMRNGVTLLDPASTYIEVESEIESDVRVLPNSRICGDTKVGSGSVIGPNTHLTDCEVMAGAVVDNSTANDALIGEGATVGPYAVLTRGAKVEPGTQTGSFVTLGEKSTMGESQ
jgi:bifunctional UDP-N-acetylglucosamine pyrophosphorylase/glucosamine-1-phosphate N-acetyltransferase